VTLTEAPKAQPLLLRVLPPGMYAGRAHILVQRAILTQRQAWMAVLSGFFEPLFYLLAFGTGLGALVGTIAYRGEALTYAEFVGPALLASSAMNGAVLDSTANVFFKFKYRKLYDMMLATPLGPFDIALGEITWSTIRGAMYTVGFLVVLGAMGLLTSPWALLMLPAAVLMSYGFGAVGMASATYMRSWQHLEYVQLLMVPMFLFSTTFYPLSVYPPALELLVQAFPLYHGVEIMRTLAVGPPTWDTAAHASYFVVMVVVGFSVVIRRLAGLLLK
jgi:lipooligosaccharide transport system permease protein